MFTVIAERIIHSTFLTRKSHGERCTMYIVCVQCTLYLGLVCRPSPLPVSHPLYPFPARISNANLDTSRFRKDASYAETSLD